MDPRKPPWAAAAPTRARSVVAALGVATLLTIAEAVGRSCPRRAWRADRRQDADRPTWATSRGRPSGGRRPRARPSTSPTDQIMASSTGRPPGSWRPAGRARYVRPERGDDQIDRCEGRDGKVVAEEAGRAGEAARRARGPQGQRRHVPTTWAPDLPVSVHHRDEWPSLCARPPSVVRCHPRRSSQRARVSSVTTTSSPRGPVVVRQWVKPRWSITRRMRRSPARRC